MTQATPARDAKTGDSKTRDIAVRATVIVALGQLVALLIFDLGHDPAGRPLQASLVNALMLQVPLYLAALLPIAAVWLIIARLMGRWRVLVDSLAIAAYVLLTFVTHLDLVMQRFRGERLSVHHVSAYTGRHLFDSAWIRPVLDAPLELMLTVTAMFATWGLLGAAWRRSRRTDAMIGSWMWAGGFALVAAACHGVTQFAYYHQRDMARAPQAVLLGGLLHARRPWDAERERAARDDLRRFLDPAGNARWVGGDEYPLWRAGSREASPSFGAAVSEPPDIIVLAVESLRGRDVGWGFGARRGTNSPTPHLDSLAHDAVTFPRWIASGEPTPRGFITAQTGAWEHGQLFIVANLPFLRVDALPERLRDAGYSTYAHWGDNPSFDNQLTFARRWYDIVDFRTPGNQVFYFRVLSDRVVIDRAIDRIDQHDREQQGKPFFTYIATAGTHTPYEVHDDSTAPAPPQATRQLRYDAVLRNLDVQAGRLVAYLRGRARWRNTVVIVIGDHANHTDEPVDARLRGLPTDATVGTSALFFGPRRLVGKPRAESIVASHVDLLPTVLSWLGDTSAVTTFGRDLFDTTRAAAREAVTVNSRGVRLDRAGYTLMVRRGDPSGWFAWKSFTGERPAMLQLSETPFAADEPQRLVERVDYWSYLAERNRGRPPVTARSAAVRPLRSVMKPTHSP